VHVKHEENDIRQQTKTLKEKPKHNVSNKITSTNFSPILKNNKLN